MDSLEENKYRYWENRFGSNITIYVHKTKDEICLTVPMGTARALTSQFFGWICVLCIIVSVYNVLYAKIDRSLPISKCEYGFGKKWHFNINNSASKFDMAHHLFIAK